MTPTARILSALAQGPATVGDIAVSGNTHDHNNIRTTLQRLENEGKVEKAGQVTKRGGHAWRYQLKTNPAPCALSEAWPMPILFPPLVPLPPRVYREWGKE